MTGANANQQDAPIPRSDGEYAETGTNQKPYESQATAALVLGILGLLVCQLLSPVAWYLARRELKAIRSGRLARGDEGIARVAMILGIVGTLLLVLGFVALALVWYYWDIVLQKIAEIMA